MDLFRNKFPVSDLVVKIFFLLDDNSVWYMDLKNGAGGCGQGPPPQEADVRLGIFNLGKFLPETFVPCEADVRLELFNLGKFLPETSAPYEADVRLGIFNLGKL
jgi:hypothetical protein